ncbi:hypothetical protein Fmac_031612 [Flemingia macrophylla]|uniref:FAF domain-containing protein n=1 Tax=Flemingia macrophylla TaxID=520843 RepID=A0ABD1L2K5_9FABA
MVKRCNTLFLPSVDDYIGTESCMDLQSLNEGDDKHHSSKSNEEENKFKPESNMQNNEKKEFPPPISLLVRTQNLPSHMPWVLKRYYTSEGRLILKEEKVRHHEYFQVHRANGRLTLQLVNVPLDDDDYDECCEESAPTSPHEEVHNISHDDHTFDNSSSNDRFAEEENVASIVADDVAVEHGSDVVVAGSGRVKSLNCNRGRPGPACMFGMPVHPIRTVHG